MQDLFCKNSVYMSIHIWPSVTSAAVLRRVPLPSSRTCQNLQQHVSAGHPFVGKTPLPAEDKLRKGCVSAVCKSSNFITSYSVLWLLLYTSSNSMTDCGTSQFPTNKDSHRGRDSVFLDDNSVSKVLHFNL